MVDLSQLYSNTFLKIIKFKESITESSGIPVKPSITENKSINKYGETEVRKICQKQKFLSEYEVEEIKRLYLEGVTTYALATAFDCHRSTISAALKKAGINGTIKRAGKDFDPEEAVRLYAEGHTSKEIGQMLGGINQLTIRNCLREHGVKIRSRWDYPRK